MRPLAAPIRQAPLEVIARELRPEQRLAAAVIAQAVEDLQLRVASTHKVQQLYASAFFFSPTGGLTFWAGIAGLDPDVVRGYVRRRVDYTCLYK